MTEFDKAASVGGFFGASVGDVKGDEDCVPLVAVPFMLKCLRASASAQQNDLVLHKLCRGVHYTLQEVLRDYCYCDLFDRAVVLATTTKLHAHRFAARKRWCVVAACKYSRADATA